MGCSKWIERNLTDLQLLQPVFTFGLLSLARLGGLSLVVGDVVVGVGEGGLLAPALRLRWLAW